jgi:hypothetical protein
MEAIVGFGLIVASAVMLYFALPKGERVVRPLRNDFVQTYYAILVLVAFVAGSLLAFVGLTGHEVDTTYQ